MIFWGLKIRFFSYIKINAWNVSDDLYEITATEGLRVEQNDFFGKGACF